MDIKISQYSTGLKRFKYLESFSLVELNGCHQTRFNRSTHPKCSGTHTLIYRPHTSNVIVLKMKSFLKPEKIR